MGEEQAIRTLLHGVLIAFKPMWNSSCTNCHGQIQQSSVFLGYLFLTGPEGNGHASDCSHGPVAEDIANSQVKSCVIVSDAVLTSSSRTSRQLAATPKPQPHCKRLARAAS